MSRRCGVRLILLVALSIWAAPLRAQNERPGVVRGVVFDSLITSRMLEGAEIWIEGTNVMPRSAASGHFALHARPPGPSLLTFYHPMLDSAGLSTPPVAVDVLADDTNTVALATPS